MSPGLFLALTIVLALIAGPTISRIVERMPDEKPVLAGFTQCSNCGEPLASLAGFPILGGIAVSTCAACGYDNRRRTVIELATLIAFVAIAFRAEDMTKALVYFWYASVLIAIFAIDLEHRLILNRMIYPAILTAPFTAWLSGVQPLGSLVGGAVALAIMLGLYFLANWLFGRESIPFGQGDVRLGLFIGLVVGVRQILPTMFVFSLVAGLVSAGLLLSGLKGRRDAIPYGPFMVVGVAWTLWGML